MLVDITTLDPSILLDIRYATPHNFTGKVLYPIARCLLQKSVAEKIMLIQKDLSQKNLGLKIWDGYRPFSVQKILWRIMPDERYIAKPVEKDGILIQGSHHNRGTAIDLTLVNNCLQELEMPSYFDEFSEKAHRNYSGHSTVAFQNMKILEQIMVHYEFIPFSTEWWHFTDKDSLQYPLSDIPIQP